MGLVDDVAVFVHDDVDDRGAVSHTRPFRTRWFASKVAQTPEPRQVVSVPPWMRTNGRFRKIRKGEKDSKSAKLMGIRAPAPPKNLRLPSSICAPAPPKNLPPSSYCSGGGRFCGGAGARIPISLVDLLSFFPLFGVHNSKGTGCFLSGRPQLQGNRV